MPRIAFEDFAPGAVFDYAGPHVTRDDIVAFAREFDPQPFHVDEDAAKTTFFGTLVGSGWHACALMMRTIADAVLLDSTSMGAPGIEETRWLTPLRPGDSLRVRQTILETKASRSRPEMGLVHMRTQLLNQDEAPILEQTNWSMFGRRGAEIAPFESDRPRPSPGAPLAEPEVAGAQFPSPLKPDAKAAPYFDDIEIGRVAELGSYGFAADDVVAFARGFDPQPFHVDGEAARRSHFGELCASGWHTGAVWMKMMVRHRQAVTEAARAAGAVPAQLGPSPGFKNLRWSKPVYVGDTITYRSVVAHKRPTASRPEWGLVFSRNSGANQFGDEVISFDGCAFWERKPA
jgi:acyl dehydratase